MPVNIDMRAISSNNGEFGGEGWGFIMLVKPID
jgi:hypothetical protein